MMRSDSSFSASSPSVGASDPAILCTQVGNVLQDLYHRFSRVKRFQIALWVVAILAFFVLQYDISWVGQELPPVDKDFKNHTTTSTLPPDYEAAPSSLRIPTSASVPAPVPAPISVPNTVKVPTAPSSSQTTPAATTDTLTSPPTISNETIPTTTIPDASPTAIAPTSPDSTLPMTPTGNSTTNNNATTAASHNDTQFPPPTPAPTVPTTPAQKPSTASAASSNRTLPIPLYARQSLTELPQTVQDAVEQYCDLAPLSEWYPQPNADDAWQWRVPHVILGGVWNAGVHTLATALQSHSQVAKRAAVPEFFLPRNFKKFQTHGAKTKVFAARQRMFAQVYPQTQTYQQQHAVAMDVSPGYLYYAGQTATSIQCVAPWAKVVLILKDPIERVYEQWKHGKQKLGLRLSLEDWIAQDIKAMQSVGLLSTNSTNNNKDTRQVWKDYQAVRNLVGVLGRSLYTFQLEEWFDVLKQLGKEPKDHIYLMRSDRWNIQTSQEYQRLIQFLDLEPQDLPSAAFPPASTYEPSLVKDETRRVLQDIFAPFNARLATLLQEHGYTSNDDDANNPWKAPLWAD